MPTPASPSTLRLCPHCGLNPLEGRGGWCRACNAEDQRKRRKKQKSLIKQLMAAVIVAKANGKKK